MMRKLWSMTAATLLAAMPHLACGAVVIDDEFDDRNVATNDSGVGTGFFTGTSAEGSTFVESGTLETVLAMIPNGSGSTITGISSKDTFDFFNADGATLTWDVHHYAASPGSYRAFVGVGDTQNNIAGTLGSPFLTNEAYVWVQLNTVDPAFGGTQGALLVDKAGVPGEPNPPTVLANWEWNSFDGISPMTITMNLDETGYDIDFSDGTTSVTGTWPENQFSASDWSGGARAIASTQAEPGGQLVFDRLQVEENEPGSGDENADFDGDGDVDGADFLTWQRGVGVGMDLSTGDANDSGTVDGTDLEIWESQFGPAALAAGTAIPEPASVLLSLLAVFAGAAARRQTRDRA